MINFRDTTATDIAISAIAVLAITILAGQTPATSAPATSAPSLSSCILQEHEAYKTSAINPSFDVCHKLYPKQMQKQIERDMRER
jgi:hypothetical protein